MSLKTCKEIRFCLGFAQPVTGRRACDGPSCRSSQSSENGFLLKSPWRSITPVTVLPAIPSRSSESRFSVPNFRFSKCFEMRPCDGPSCPWRSVVGSVASASFSRIEVCCSKRLNRSLQLTSLMWIMMKGLFSYNYYWATQMMIIVTTLKRAMLNNA